MRRAQICAPDHRPGTGFGNRPGPLRRTPRSALPFRGGHRAGCSSGSRGRRGRHTRAQPHTASGRWRGTELHDGGCCGGENRRARPSSPPHQLRRAVLVRAGRGHSPHWLHGQANAGPQAPPDGTATAQDATTSMRRRPLSLSRPFLAPPRDHRRERRAPSRSPVPSDLSGAPLHRLPTAPARPARATTHRRRPTQPSRPGRRRARHTKPSTAQTAVRARDPSAEQPPPRKPPKTPGRGESDPFPEATVKDADLRQCSRMPPDRIATWLVKLDLRCLEQASRGSRLPARRRSVLP